MIGLLFWAFALLAVFSGLMVVTRRNPVHGALYLVLCMLCLGGIFLLLEAPLLAMLQVIVYAGAVMVLILFVIMVLNLERERDELPDHALQKLFGVVLGVLGMMLLVNVVAPGALRGVRGEFTPERLQSVGHVRALAEVLFGKYLLPFEVISVLLLAALIGAVVLAKRRL